MVDTTANSGISREHSIHKFHLSRRDRILVVLVSLLESDNIKNNTKTKTQIQTQRGNHLRWVISAFFWIVTIKKKRDVYKCFEDHWEVLGNDGDIKSEKKWRKSVVNSLSFNKAHFESLKKYRTIGKQSRNEDFFDRNHRLVGSPSECFRERRTLRSSSKSQKKVHTQNRIKQYTKGVNVYFIEPVFVVSLKNNALLADFEINHQRQSLISLM